MADYSNSSREVMVVGSVALDTIKTSIGEQQRMLGGSAVYFSIAASLYTPVRLVGVVGDDFPDRHFALLRRKGIDLRGLQQVSGKTFAWGGEYGHDVNERDTLFTELGVFETFRPSLPESYKRTPCLFLGNIDPDLQMSVLNQVENPLIVAGDTMNFWIDLKPSQLIDVISRLHVLMVNDGEIRQLTGDPNLVRGARSLFRRGVRSIVVKKGEHGATMFMPGDTFFAPPYPLELVVDPTGAGDSFAGGFMGYLSCCGSVTASALRTAVIHGSVIASYCVEAFGVERLAALTMEEVQARVVEFRKLTAFDTCTREGTERV
jgi:sugar/nucleoside kinase (ribokinase family)